MAFQTVTLRADSFGQSGPCVAAILEAHARKFLDIKKSRERSEIARAETFLSVNMIAVQRMRFSLERVRAHRTDAARLVLVPREASEADLVYERVAPTVNRLVWIYLATDPERDDIAQDIVESILRRRNSVRDPERLEAWAGRVAFNAICNAFRRRRLRRWLSLDLLPEGEQPEYQTDHEGRQLVARAQRVLESLPPAERMPLTLELFTNASQAEIARLCGCSERTVRRRLAVAREHFSSLARRDPALASKIGDGPAQDARNDE